MDQRAEDRWGDPMLELMRQEEAEEKAKKEKKKQRKLEKKQKKLEKKKKKMKKHLKKMGVKDVDATVEMLAADEPEKEEIEETLETIRSRRPMYEGAPWPNRYRIRPGYRWDGVDRGNGWEEKRFKLAAERQAMQVTKYHYSVEDM